MEMPPMELMIMIYSCLAGGVPPTFSLKKMELMIYSCLAGGVPPTFSMMELMIMIYSCLAGGVPPTFSLMEFTWTITFPTISSTTALLLR